MSRFVDDLLLLAKAERDDFLRVGDLELGALTDELMDKSVAPRQAPLAAGARAARRPWSPTASGSHRR